MQPLRWCHLHFPLLPLECHYQRAEPGAAILLDRNGQRVRLCNDAARAAGISPGMSAARARQLRPDLVCYRHQSQYSLAALEGLALHAGRFSAEISLCPPRGLLLEVGSMIRLFGGHERLLTSVENAFSALGYRLFYSLGHTPAAARLLARHAPGRDSDPERLRRRLLGLSTRTLEIARVQRATLQALGLNEIGALLQLPRDELVERLGESLADYLDRLVGRKADPQQRFAPPPSFCRQLELEQEAEHAAALLFPLRRLLAMLEGYLHSRQLLATRLSLILRSQGERDRSQTLRLSHPRGVWQTADWLPLWQLRLERTTLSAPVIGLTLQAEGLIAQRETQRDLFGGMAEEERMSLLARLQSRLGEASLRAICRVADHRPEHSWTWAAPGSSGPSLPSAPPRPCWLLAQPEPLPAPPERLRLELLDGPERIAAGWWSDAPVRRDYYSARWPDGRIGWIYRDDRRQWYLHGWFG